MKTFRHNFKNHLLPKLKQINGSGGRFYETENGIRYPSITSMISHFSAKSIQEWRQRIGPAEADKITRKSATRGTKFHKVCETYLMNQELLFETPMQQQMFINTKQYVDRIDEIQLLETRLISHHLRLAGTVDCIAAFDNKLSVVDFKSSLRAKKIEYIQDHFVQAAAYAIMYEEMTKIPVSQLVIVIAIEGEPSQIFIDQRDNHTKKLISLRNEYEKNNSIHYSTAHA